MSTDVERRLTELLHRRADDAMDRTDTQEELREFLSRHRDEHPQPRRWPTVIGAALAAAAVAAAVFWGTGLTDDRTGPEPVDDPRPRAVRVAERFAAAYAAGDVERAASFLAPGAEPWDGWRSDAAEEKITGATYSLDECGGARALGPSRTEVTCPFAFHAFGSEELGLGPFENAFFTVIVDGANDVESATVSWNQDNNGFVQHRAEVHAWMKLVYVYDYPLMKRHYEELSADEKVVWTRMWTEHLQKYIETH